MAFFKETINLSQGEEMVGMFRSHSVVAVISITPFAVALFILCLFVFPLSMLGMKGILIFFAILLFDLFFIFTLISQWIGTLLIVTTRRIIKIDRRSMFKKRVNEYQLETITEIAYDSKGILQTIFALGDINITALYTGMRHTIITCVAQPQHVLDTISHTISRVQRKSDAQKRPSGNLHTVGVGGDDDDHPL